MNNGWAVWTGMAALAVAGAVTLADTVANPYESIVTRNPFNLKDPPPPAPPPAPPAPPPPPMPTVKLRGITTILSSKKAILEITEPGGKGGPQSRIMPEGERHDSVEVITISPDGKEPFVTVKIGDWETNLFFEKVDTAKAAPAGPAPGAVPVFRPPGFPGAPTPTMIRPAGASTATPAGSSVFVMGAGGNPAAASVSGVATFGAPVSPTSAGAVPGIPTISPAAAISRPATTFGTPTAFGTPTIPGMVDPGLRTIPTRQIRTDTPTGTPAATTTTKPMTREEVDLLIEMNRERNRGKNMPPLPPTSLSPFIDHPDTKHFPPSMQSPGQVPVPGQQ